MTSLTTMTSLTFVSREIQDAFFAVPIHPIMLDMLAWVDEQWALPITSAYRPNKIHKADTGIHSTNPLRAIDLRSKDIKHPLYIEAEICATWIYDPTRPALRTCVYHDTGRGPHFHIQVHANTYRR